MDKAKFYRIMRMTSGIIGVCGIVVTFFIFVLIEPYYWGFIPLIITLVFVALTFWFRKLQREQESVDNPPPARGDFITGKIPVDPFEDDLGGNGNTDDDRDDATSAK